MFVLAMSTRLTFALPVPMKFWLRHGGIAAPWLALLRHIAGLIVVVSPIAYSAYNTVLLHGMVAVVIKLLFARIDF
jgi:hypothetical protein